ncbi:hypothetical protein NE237_006964 [Protea cynaroides]|uniref:Uncharacterized protein n=1 Tax=Protea cynaroides TaxID=273540 RepID=A0A9Q0KNJ7_9MAGN|nr:hypothetical protein NE237_006964 [Protea cynaroides]
MGRELLGVSWERQAGGCWVQVGRDGQGAAGCELGEMGRELLEGDADNLDIQDGSEVPPVEPTTDVTEEGDVHHTPQAAAAHRLDMTPSALRKRSRSTDIMGAINAMVEHSKARLDLFTTSHTSSASPSPSSISTGGYSITQCLAVLNTIPRLDKVTYIKTMNHLTNNAEWRELFMGLDEEKKLWAIESIP